MAADNEIQLDRLARSFAAVGELTFEEPDVERFPCLALARQDWSRALGIFQQAIALATQVKRLGRLQLRLGRDSRWYPYARSDQDWEPSGAPGTDPVLTLANL